MVAVTASPALCPLTGNQSANYLRVLHSIIRCVLSAEMHTSASPSLSPAASLSESWSLPEAAPPQVRPLGPPVLASSPLVLASSNDLYLSLSASASSSPADSSELLAKYACGSIRMFMLVYKTGKCISHIIRCHQDSRVLDDKQGWCSSCCDVAAPIAEVCGLL